MASKVSDITPRLRAEEAHFLDYREISRRSAELGFPTSVRTLRFYVTEGVLPSPHKQGKTPVFAEDEIFNLLLAIHLMKTRFGLSLSEIRRVLEGQRGDPGRLVEACSALYLEVSGDSPHGRVEREWLTSAFFRTLTGELLLYPRARRGVPGQRSAGEVELTELTDDLQRVAGWIRRNDQWEWISPEAVLIPKPLTGRRSMKTHRASQLQPRRPRITPIDPPSGAIDVLSARRREEHFLERFDRNVQRLTKIYNPIERKNYSVRASALDPEIFDPYQRVVEILKGLEKYDRSLLENLPHDRSTRYGFPTGGLFGRKKPKIVVAGVVRSPIEKLADAGYALGPLNREALLEAVHDTVKDHETYYVVGVLSTVGWDPHLFDKPPRGENFSVVLIDPLPGSGWRVHDSLPPKLAELRAIFDPEEFGEKVSRTFYRIVEDEELAIPGGHLEVERLLAETGVDRHVLDAALEQIQLEDSRIQRTTIAGQELLKRDRY